MTNSQKKDDKTVCIIDTNFLIEYKNIMPIKYFPLFWERLKDHINNGDIIVLDCVAQEFRDKGYEKWKKEIKITDSKKLRVKSIELNEKYKLADNNNDSNADPFIVAIAQQYSKKFVFTLEKSRQSNKKDKYTIPDVCRDLDIPCESSFEKLLEVIKFKKI